MLAKPFEKPNRFIFLTAAQWAILLLLLAAFFLRVYRLGELPPGLTHDEANHGREAIGVLAGERPYFFPYNYGSEPLYSYTVAGLMGLVGQGIFALRMVNVLCAVVALAVAFAWVRRAFDVSTAVLTVGVTAVSFWPLASSREALRAGMMPLLMGIAVWAFWHIIKTRARPWGAVALLTVALTAAFHNYLAARMVWVLFPVFLVYLALWHRPIFRRAVWPTVVALLCTGFLIAPMFLYLRQHPEMQPRVQMLDGDLNALRQGNPMPVLENSVQAFAAFFVPGQGDQFLAYNVPGRAVLSPLTALLFLVGLGICVWRWRRPAYALLLLWFLVGVGPSLVTGATANTTRNVAGLIPVYVIPAVGFMALVRARVTPVWVKRGVATVWLVIAGWMTWQAYFHTWGEAAEVQEAYLSSVVEAVRYTAAANLDVPIVLASHLPNVAHDPSVGLVVGEPEEAPLRWVSAKSALVYPGGEATYLAAVAAAPIHPYFAETLTVLAEHPLPRPHEERVAFTWYEMGEPVWPTAVEPPVNFNDAIDLVGAAWLGAPVEPGGVVVLATMWKVRDPERVGPRVLPAKTTDVVLFTHVLGEDGGIIAQADLLDAPSWAWQAGDVIVQIHTLGVPNALSAGGYTAVVGVYDRASGARLPLADGSGDVAVIEPLHIIVP